MVEFKDAFRVEFKDDFRVGNGFMHGFRMDSDMDSYNVVDSVWIQNGFTHGFIHGFGVEAE